MTVPLQQKTGKVIALVRDLMFAVKIQHAAKVAGTPVAIVPNAEALLSQAREGASLIILDLSDLSVNALDAIAKLRSDSATAPIRLLGFVSHVQTDMIKAAREAGCDLVLARSAFSQKLPELLSELSSGGPPLV